MTSEYHPDKITQEELEVRYKNMLLIIADKIAKEGIPFKKVSTLTVFAIIESFINILKRNGRTWSDTEWPYWDRRETNAPGKCKMLDMCFKIEKKPGIMLHLNLDKNVKLK